MYAIQEIPGRGRGMIALETIPRGTRILSEEPIITSLSYTRDLSGARNSIFQQVNALSDTQRQAFFSLHNIHPYNNPLEQSFGIFRSVALPLEDSAGDEMGGIFLDGCRINHACDNNAQKSWNTSINRHTVHALQDIQKGEEVTIYYFGVDKIRADRQQELQARFGFTCTCRLCSLPPAMSKKSDQRITEIRRLHDLMEVFMTGLNPPPLSILRLFENIVRLYNEQRPGHPGLSCTYFDAAQVAITHGDLARGRVFARRAVEEWTVSLGSDSPSVIQYGHLARDLPKHVLYARLSNMWKTAVDDVPHGLVDPSDEFEDWLWRRETRTQPASMPSQQQRLQLADLRNRTTFPNFNSLPHEYDIDDNFFSIVNNGSRMGSSTYRPRRHWCFLAEITITDVGYFVRRNLHVTDRDGETVLLAFHTDGRGSEMDPWLLRQGYTVAILYAEYHQFAFSPPGIRLEDSGTIKIFPMSLKELLALSDRIQEFSQLLDGGQRRCHGCGKTSTSLNRCARCSLFWYCDKNCQTTGWHQKGHKVDCKQLKDDDLRAMFLLNWDSLDDFVTFPLRANIT
ncbi:hypothetical protein B0T17DRAFT_496265 [Bombardia bombarda]|uniref:MYND-type zinc finger protein samB n=1 Tax=Bombardia bombarda TaxID=252184 RepID=A0AA39WLT1_9PEZI|nr:hypothetical protein B0T17DRAFT_496265 [Bombardia bombarda]